MTIDTSLAAANGHELMLDFSDVSRRMEFVFEEVGDKEVQELLLGNPNKGDTFRLAYAVKERQRIELKGTDLNGDFTITVPNPAGGDLQRP